jgi:hypothetical protein
VFIQLEIKKELDGWIDVMLMPDGASIHLSVLEIKKEVNGWMGVMLMGQTRARIRTDVPWRPARRPSARAGGRCS